MKTRNLLVALLFLLQTQNSYSQYFNHMVPDYSFYYTNLINFVENSGQTIAHDVFGNIAFISVNQANPGQIPEIMLMDQQGNYLASKKIDLSPDSLFPISIIATMDTGFIVLGTVMGPTKPTGYPVVPQFHTVYYAKFDDQLNLVWSNVLYDYPFTNHALINEPEQDAYSIVAVPGVVVSKSGTLIQAENYFILSQCSGFDQLWNWDQSLAVTKIDFYGNVVNGIRFYDPYPYYYQRFEESYKISYLPASNVLAINGTVADYINGNSYIFVAKTNPSLSTLSNITEYTSTPNTYTGFNNSNIIEGKKNDTSAYMSFTFDDTVTYYNPCSNTSVPINQVLLIVNFDIYNPSHIYWANEYIPTCDSSWGIEAALVLKNTSDSDIMAGFSQITNLPGAIGKDRFNPGLLKIDESGNVLTYHNYVLFSDTSNWMSGFDNYILDSFIVHTDQNVLLSPGMSHFSRIIKTDVNGSSDCADTEGVYNRAVRFNPVDTSLVRVVDTVRNYAFIPVDSVTQYLTISCDTHFHKPALIQTVEPSGAFRIYPNPAKGDVNIQSGLGQFQNISIFDLSGRKLLDEPASPQQQTQHLHLNLDPGVYFITLTDSQRLRQTQRLVIY